MDSYERKRKQHGSKSTSLDIVVGTQNYADVIAPRTNHQIFVQRITLSITTHFDGTITFDDDGSGPPIAVFTDEATVIPTVPSSWTWDFGPDGRAIVGNLDVNQSAAGIVGIVRIEAYQKLTSVINTGTANTAN
jgi:hypothetical protein